jgi:large subunit ribosomal protein L15
MRLNTIKSADGARTVPKRVGRGIGSGLGKTAGRGHKGSYARTGKGKIKPGFEGGQMPIQRRLPKVGFRSKLKADMAEIRLYQLEQLKDTTVDLAALKAANLIDARAKQCKVVVKGEVKRAYTLKGLLATAGAKSAIEAAGGKME